MKSWRLALAASIVGVCLAGCAPFQTIPPMPPHLTTMSHPEQDQADAKNRALWGIYVDLAGTSWLSPRDGGRRLQWRWLRPGWVIEEAVYIKGAAEPLHTYLLWRGELPGTLYSRLSSLMSMAWKGWVQPDNTVLFESAAPLSFSYQARLSNDGAFEVRLAEIQNGALVSLQELLPQDRYEQVGTASGGVTSVAQKAPKATAAPKATPVPKASQQVAASSAASVNKAQQALDTAQAEAAQMQRLLSIGMHLWVLSDEVPDLDEYEGEWSECRAGVRTPDGKDQLFITNLLNEPLGVLRSHKEQGMRMMDDASQDFEEALEASGLLPPHLYVMARCRSHDSLAFARYAYDKWLSEAPTKVTRLYTPSLDFEYVAKMPSIPSAADMRRLVRANEEAQEKLSAAQKALRQAQSGGWR